MALFRVFVWVASGALLFDIVCLIDFSVFPDRRTVCVSTAVRFGSNVISVLLVFAILLALLALFFVLVWVAFGALLFDIVFLLVLASFVLPDRRLVCVSSAFIVVIIVSSIVRQVF